jgi:hypothetical protein
MNLPAINIGGALSNLVGGAGQSNSQVITTIAQNVAMGLAGNAVIASLGHPDVLKILDPLGLTNIIHPVTGGAVAGAAPATPAAISATTGLNPTAKTMTIAWYQANPTVAPLYLGQGWALVAA